MALFRIALALCAWVAEGQGGLDSLLGGLNAPGGQSDQTGALADMLAGLMGGMQSNDKEEPLPVCMVGKEPAPKMDHHEQMSANGCGPQGLQIKEGFGLHRCCNGHDVCFSVCGTSHDYCEKEFRSCMKKVCKAPLDGSKRECKDKAKTFQVLTKSFGMSFHHTSQRASCDCLKGKDVSRRHRQYLRSFFQRYNTSQAADELLDDTLSRWKGKEAELYFQLVKTYGTNFVRFEDIEPEFHVEAEL